MPYRAVETARAQRHVRLLEQAVQVAEVAAAIVAEWWFQLAGVPPASDEVRIGVRLVSAWAV